MAIENIKVPDLGDADEVEVIELLVSVGDKVEENDSLLVLESDKAAMEIPAPKAGVVKSIAVNLGDQVKAGNDMLTLEVEGDDAGDADDSGKESGKADAEQEQDEEQDTEQDNEKNKEQDKEKNKEQDKEQEPEQEADEKQDDDADSDNDDEEDSGGGTTVVEVPDLGTDDEVEVIEIHVKPGDDIAIDDSLITLESDKAAMEVPATAAGKVEEVLVSEGDKVKTGSAILKISGAGGAKSKAGGDAGTGEKDKDSQDDKDEGSEKEQESEQKQDGDEKEGKDKKADKGDSELSPAAKASAPGASRSGKVYAGPAVRKLARELGVDLTQVEGSGAKSRIVKEDVHEFVKARLSGGAAAAPGVAAIPDIDFSQFGEIEKVERSKLDKLTANNMQRNWSALPHVTQFNEADVTELEDFRASLKKEADKRGTKLTPLPFLIKACAKALAEYPQFNVSLHSSGEYLIQKKYFHIGMAVATPAGLLVPVIRDVDKKSIWEIADEVLEVSQKARDRKLSREDMQGACFTISSLGAIGGTGFTPIINAPEVAILGVSKTQVKPVYQDGEFVPRKLLPLALSYDHRAVNGVDGGMFADYLVKLLGDIRNLLL